MLLEQGVDSVLAAAHLLDEQKPSRHRDVDGKMLARMQPVLEVGHEEPRPAAERLEDEARDEKARDQLGAEAEDKRDRQAQLDQLWPHDLPH